MRDWQFSPAAKVEQPVREVGWLALCQRGRADRRVDGLTGRVVGEERVVSGAVDQDIRRGDDAQTPGGSTVASHARAVESRVVECRDGCEGDESIGVWLVVSVMCQSNPQRPALKRGMLTESPSVAD